MREILFLLIVGIIAWNSLVNFAILLKIVTYTFKTGSIKAYWTLLFKNCLSVKTIISSFILLNFGIMIFIIITPFVIIYRNINKNKLALSKASGAVFDYLNQSLTKGVFQFNNVETLGIAKFEVKGFGEINKDWELITNSLLTSFKRAGIYNKEIKVFQEYDLSNNLHITIPIVVNEGEKVYPVYPIYTEEHKQLFQKIHPELIANYFEEPIYISLIPME